MTLARWIAPLALGTLLAACGSHGDMASHEHCEASEADCPEVPPQVVVLEVTEQGFSPAETKVHVGHSVKLVITRKLAATCATEVVIADYDVRRDLPLGVPVEVTITPTKAGRIRFACAMDMVAGYLVAE